MIEFILGYLLASGGKKDDKSYIGPNSLTNASVITPETIMEILKERER